jgi:hypothetical protein
MASSEEEQSIEHLSSSDEGEGSYNDDESLDMDELWDYCGDACGARLFLRSSYHIRQALRALREGRVPDVFVTFVFITPLNFDEDREAFGLAMELLGEYSSKYPDRLFDLHFYGRADPPEEEYFPTPLFIADIASLLNQMPNQLKSVVFTEHSFHGRFGPLIEAVQSQQRLELFKLGMDFTSYDGEPADFINLARALSVLPNLKRIEIWFDSMDIPNASKLEMMIICAESKTLKELIFILWGVRHEDLDFQRLFALIGAHSSLKGFDLGGKLSAANTYHVANMIKRDSSIESLSIRVQSGVPLLPIAESMELNSTLRTLTIKADACDEDRKLFLSLLKEGENCTLEF